MEPRELTTEEKLVTIDYIIEKLLREKCEDKRYAICPHLYDQLTLRGGFKVGFNIYDLKIFFPELISPIMLRQKLRRIIGLDDNYAFNISDLQNRLELLYEVKFKLERNPKPDTQKPKPETK